MKLIYFYLITHSIIFSELLLWRDVCDDELRNLEIYQIGKDPVLPKNFPIFYLGNGFKIGEKQDFNCFIGNECTGVVERDIYVNVMFYVE